MYCKILPLQGRRQRGGRGGRGGGRRPNNFEKKISKYLKVLINGTASALASDHLWSMVRQSVAS